jgi:hypothetical protein
MVVQRVAQDGDTRLAWTYLHLFRRLVVGAAIVGGGVAWAEGFTGLAGALGCIALGEFLESSYYISVMRWSRSLE